MKADLSKPPGGVSPTLNGAHAEFEDDIGPPLSKADDPGDVAEIGGPPIDPVANMLETGAPVAPCPALRSIIARLAEEPVAAAAPGDQVAHVAT